MRIISKERDEIVLLALHSEEITKGDYLIIEDADGRKRRSLLVQVYDEEYHNTQSLLEDMIRDEVVNAASKCNPYDPLEMGSITRLVRDARLLRCKVRASIEDGRLGHVISWLPSRVSSRIRRVDTLELNSFIHGSGADGSCNMHPIRIGYSMVEGEPITIYAEDLDGRLNLITGKKGSGKSHLAKSIVKSLAEYGAYLFVLDLNNEYLGIAWRHDGGKSSVGDKVLFLEPGRGLRFTLEYVGKGAIAGMLKHALDMPAASLREFFRIWDALASRNRLSISNLIESVVNWRANELVKDALTSRLHTMLTSGLFADGGGVRVEDIVRERSDGAVVIIGMGRAPPVVRRMTVELLLSKLVELLEQGKIPPIFLFAEEAHLYLRDTYWEDIVTRMRHFGIFTTFITNQPDAISDGIYRQLDNIFLFNFTNENDLEKIARASMVDSESIKSIVRTLPAKHCMIIGSVVNNLPIVIRTAQPEVLMLGETKRFFSNKRAVRDAGTTEIRG
ncbi:MAG: DUF87 domain-containing protein [Candidatus Nitrosocaldus sp.]|nr:DUF87 domain-containing protein [Candidatus Nitrosocaldus sp.]MCS7141663.1 DUF87 domain-containing protein [Candidatus Nitrosocaldus sp.]MDW8000682.1 DUF87 domain-containing protein [Candidatus Nitrosocaldus sp.]MDW8276255.1 DUF87 domain-containing protein [Candidatus Nitrosocaldus sp.]